MPQLKQVLTKFDLVMIAIGSTIGSGIFLTPAAIAHELSAPWLIFVVWIIGGLMAIAGALTFAELGGMMPGAGGVYVYLSEAYGGMLGFLYGWSYLLVTNTGGLAALSIAFTKYFSWFVPLDPLQEKLFAISGLVLLTIINVFGVKLGGIFSDVFTLLKLLGIGVLIAVGLGWGSSATTDFGASLGDHTLGIGSALAVAMVGVLWSYGGWQHASYAAAEAKDPRRTVPFAMIVGAIVVAAVYLLTNLAYMFLLPPDAIGNSERVAADAISVVMGPNGAAMIAVVIFISTFGTAGIYTLTAPRIYFAMANDGVFFKKVAEVHPTYHTPAVAIVVQCIWAIVLILFWGTFDKLISYVVFTDWIFFGLTGASIFIFRKTKPAVERPYRTSGYPVTPLFFVATSAWFVLNTLIERPDQALVGLAFLGLGIPVYWFWKRKSAATISSSTM